jgi:succinate dehydrogenase/fumarate reductase flavoprotein subunit
VHRRGRGLAGGIGIRQYFRIARTNAPAVVTQRRPENRIVNIPIADGTPTTRAIAMSGRTGASTISVSAMPRISPTAVPTSKALVSTHARGTGITLMRLAAAPVVTPSAARRAL